MATHQGRWCRGYPFVSFFIHLPLFVSLSSLFVTGEILRGRSSSTELGRSVGGAKETPRSRQPLLTRCVSSPLFSAVISLSTITFSTSTTPSTSSLPVSPMPRSLILTDTSLWVVVVKLTESTSRLKRCKSGSIPTSELQTIYCYIPCNQD